MKMDTDTLLALQLTRVQRGGVVGIQRVQRQQGVDI